MNIVICGEFSFPFGMASARYVYLIAKGLHENGADVFVMPLKATEINGGQTNNKGSGMVDGIRYAYATGSPIWKPQLVRRIFLAVRSEIYTFLLLLKKSLRPGKSVDVLFYYGASGYQVKKIRFYSRLFRFKLIVSLVEWDPAIPNATAGEIKKANRFVNAVAHCSDAVVVISSFLQTRMEELLKAAGKSTPLYKMPILLDHEEWNGIQAGAAQGSYILYCADLGTYKPDVYFVLRAFARLGYSEYTLRLVGKANQKDLDEINQLIDELQLKNKVSIQNKYLGQEELYKLFAGAKALLAPLHNSERSLARFPLKIADYLMSGNPVVSSKVGEVKTFLADGELAFLADPENLEDFSNTLSRALTDPHSSEIAKKGRDFAKDTFDYRNNVKGLLQFFNSVE